MKSKQTMFFAVLEDVEHILRDIEATMGIRYYKAGLLDSESIPTYDSIFDAPNVGVAISGDWNKIDRYIILKRATPLKIREVPQRAGGVKFAVDPMVNPKSIEFKLGGIYQEKENVIVAGRIGTISEESDSDELYKLFEKKIKKNFKRIGMFYVGKEAEEKLKTGWRLVTNEKSPREYDLAFS